MDQFTQNMGNPYIRQATQKDICHQILLPKIDKFKIKNSRGTQKVVGQKVEEQTKNEKVKSKEEDETNVQQKTRHQIRHGKPRTQ